MPRIFDAHHFDSLPMRWIRRIDPSQVSLVQTGIGIKDLSERRVPYENA
jgi:hypothetical protein